MCQRWRDLIFIFRSLRHFGVHFVVSRKSPKTPLDSLPALPLSVWYPPEDCMPSEQVADIVAAFEHSDHIYETSLPPTMGYSFWKPLCKKSFLELEHLAFSWYGNPLALPSEFLGGSSSPRRLHNILLKGLYCKCEARCVSEFKRDRD